MYLIVFEAHLSDCVPIPPHHRYPEEVPPLPKTIHIHLVPAMTAASPVRRCLLALPPGILLYRLKYLNKIKRSVNSLF